MRAQCLVSRFLLTMGMLVATPPALAAAEPARDSCASSLKSLMESHGKVPDHCPCVAGPLLEVTGATQHVEAIQAEVRAVLVTSTGDSAPVAKHHSRVFQVQDAAVPVRTVTLTPQPYGASVVAHAPCGDRVMVMDAEAVAFLHGVANALRAQRNVALRVKVISLDPDSPVEPAR